jgi:transposase InsO family protein
LLKSPVLEPYDPRKPLLLYCDASPYGVGAMLAHKIGQEEKPVFFASSSLSKAEREYSQVHREALAVMFGIKKFHNYIYGQKFVLCTDNEALKEIFSPNKNTSKLSASRLQRWAVQLSMYEYEIKHVPGKLNAAADAMSRLPLPEVTTVEEIYSMSESLLPLVSKEHVKEKTQSDVILKQVLDFVQTQFPKAIPNNLVDFHRNKKDLSSEDGCLYYRDRLVIPFCLREVVLNQLHTNHDGIVRMKMVARSSVWWPRIDSCIEEIVSHCVPCQQTQNVSKEKVTTKWRKSTKPMERLHTDLFHVEGKECLLIIDTFTKFIEAVPLSKSDTRNVLEELFKFFKYFGYAAEVVSDNGPPFNSDEFKRRLEELNIKVTKSPVYHPQSNGSAERGVKTIKNSLKKYLLDHKFSHMNFQQKLTRVLFNYNQSPSTVTKKSPAEMMLSFIPSTNFSQLTKTKKVDFDLSKNKYYSTSHNKKDQPKIIQKFQKGEKVMYRNHFKNYVKWIPAVVHEIVSPLTYKVIVSGSLKYVHQNQIRHSELEDQFHPSIYKAVHQHQVPLKEENEKPSRSKKNKAVTEAPVRRSARIQNQSSSTYASRLRDVIPNLF